MNLWTTLSRDLKDLARNLVFSRKSAKESITRNLLLSGKRNQKRQENVSINNLRNLKAGVMLAFSFVWIFYKESANNSGCSWMNLDV